MIWLCGPAQQIAGVYDEAMMETYKKEQWTKLPPHVFATAEMAFLHMQLHAQSQSLVVSGESGAGKTESFKRVVQYISAATALASPSAPGRRRDGGAHSSIEAVLLDTVRLPN